MGSSRGRKAVEPSKIVNADAVSHDENPFSRRALSTRLRCMAVMPR